MIIQYLKNTFIKMKACFNGFSTFLKNNFAFYFLGKINFKSLIQNLFLGFVIITIFLFLALIFVYIRTLSQNIYELNKNVEKLNELLEQQDQQNSEYKEGLNRIRNNVYRIRINTEEINKKLDQFIKSQQITEELNKQENDKPQNNEQNTIP